MYNEALETIFKIERKINSAPFRINAEYIEDELELLKKVLKPPTAEEVCEVMSKCLNKKVTYIRGGFLANYEAVDLNKLSWRIISLLGRFYEGLENV